jgi:sec-independent protein translocase protein TatC
MFIGLNPSTADEVKNDPTVRRCINFAITWGYGGLIIALPIIMWQLWKFIVPALNKQEKKYSIPFIVTSVILFLTGAWLAYWTLDKALEFLIAWSGAGVEQTYQISKYISLVAMMVLAFGAGFLVPVLVVFLLLVIVWVFDH